MDPTVENIKCVKDGVEKLFSQRQLDLIGYPYDGWVPQTKKPIGIPDVVALPVGADIENAELLIHPVDPTDAPAIDPFLGIPVIPDPNANVAVATEPVAPVVDEAKVEKVKKK